MLLSKPFSAEVTFQHLRRDLEVACVVFILVKGHRRTGLYRKRIMILQVWGISERELSS